MISSSNRQEQVQEIISENIQDCEILKYICVPHALSNNGHAKIPNKNNHENTCNRLIRLSLSYLNNDRADVIIIHDPCMPYVDEKVYLLEKIQIFLFKKSYR